DRHAADAPIQAALGAPYAHVTAPLRRLVDRFGLVICEALANHMPVPAWATDALPSLPALMAASAQLASRLENGAVSAVEAAVLSAIVGELFDATVISAGDGRGVIQQASPAVSATSDGAINPGGAVLARVVRAEIASGDVQFVVAG